MAATSADGRYVAFSSDAPDLVFNDINARDVFVRDRVMSTTELVSVASNEMQANRSALFPAISADGRYVVFASEADNLAPNDTNDKSDIFIRDRQLGATQRLSVDSSGAQASDDSLTPSISGDGRYVTFTSRAEDLVLDDANGTFDAFVHDRDTGVTELVSVASDGTHGNFASGGAGAGPARISSDGRYAVFGSFASNLVGDDGNGVDDVFVRDRQLGITDRVSIATGGTEGNSHSIYGSVSDDGRYAVFESTADTLTPDDDNQASDVFLRDRQLATTVPLSDASDTEQGNGASHFAAISADGEAVAFQSDAFNLVSGDGNGTTDV
ncbi:MAG: hypothetical protein U1B78_04260, partial [Dehalococcoidia bacterium]|nr:hypothetical protein [Dehalococcoidia bacterium]